MDKAALRGVFDWGRCQSCMMVSEGWDSLPPSSVPCPHCGEKGFGADWPPQPARLILRQAFQREADEQGEFAVKAFLVAAALDVLLEWVLIAAVDYLSTESAEIADLIHVVDKPSLSTEQRLDLLRKVLDVRYQEVADLLEEPDLPSRWADLREKRDRFVHAQEVFAFDPLSEADLVETARMAVKVLAHINNLIW